MGSAVAKIAASTAPPAMDTSHTVSPATGATRTYISSTTINDLPQEMLLEIVKQIHGSQKALYNLCLVKPFNAAATEALYQSEHIYRTEGTGRLLLRTLLENPKLAALVRHLRLTPSCIHISLASHREELAIPPEEVELFRRAVDGLNLSDSEDSEGWKETINSRRCTGVLCALLMLHTPNVTSITFKDHCLGWSPSDPYDVQSWDWWEAAIPRHKSFFTSASPQPFSRLKEMRVNDALTMIQVASIMRLPALEKLTIWGVTDGGKDSGEATPDHWSPTMFPQRSTRIRSLELSGEFIHEDALSTLIDACQGLEFFCYGPWSDQGGMYTKTPRNLVSLAKVIRSLYEHQTTLHSLALYYTGYSGPISSLSGFIKLERLCIDTSLLYFDRNAPAESLRGMLPSSIRRLRLQGTLPCLFTDPSDSLCGSKGVDVAQLVLPQLEYLGLGMKEDWEKDTDAFLDRWCRKADFEFISDNYRYEQPWEELSNWHL
jgi:hypothetical protein